MPHDDPDVNGTGRPNGARVVVVAFKTKCIGFIDAHPRVGWYVAVLATVNTVLNILELFH